MLASLAKRFDPFYISGNAVSGPDSTPISKVSESEQALIELAREMDGHWLGPMPIDEFFNEFLRPSNGLPDLPDIPEDLFKDIPSRGLKTTWYAPFISAIEGWMPRLKAVNTSTKKVTVNEPKLKTGISIYQRREGVQIPDRTDFSQMELWIEFKSKTEGVAFKDPEHQESDGERRSASGNTRFASDTKDGIHTRGQLIQYASAVDGEQFRNFSFSILIEGNDARFLRWDISGTIVSAAFNYRERPRPMAEFLWRFNHLSPKERGHDASVEPAGLPTEIEARIREKLNVDDGIPLYRYSVPGLIGRGYACGPRLPAQDRPIITRRTRSSPLVWIPAREIDGCAVGGDSSAKEDGNPAAGEEGATTKEPWDEERMIYMKDTWQYPSDILDMVILPEHEVYAILRKHSTPNIPEHVEGGNVDGGGTRTQEFANASWLDVKARILARQRYRLVHGVVGRPLVKFDCTKQLVTAVLDALKAHSHAYENAKILHCDISVGNIILTDEGRGLLIDWEMAKMVDVPSSKQPGRAGTWQFMSAKLLMNSEKVNAFEDDLESFLHVLAWTTLRYVPATDKYPPEFRGYDMGPYNEHLYLPGRGEYGGSRKSCHFFSRGYPSDKYQPRKPTPLQGLLRELRKPFISLYDGQPPTDEDRRKIQPPLDFTDWELIRVLAEVEQYDERMGHLKSSSWFVEQMTKALEEQDWPTDDAGELLPIVYPRYRAEFQAELSKEHRRRRRDSQTILLESVAGIAGGAKRPASSSPESERPLKRLRSGSFAGPGSRS